MIELNTFNEINATFHTKSSILILNSNSSIDIFYYVVDVIYSTCILLHMIWIWYCRYIFLNWYCNLPVDIVDLGKYACYFEMYIMNIKSS